MTNSCMDLNLEPTPSNPLDVACCDAYPVIRICEMDISNQAKTIQNASYDTTRK